MKITKSIILLILIFFNTILYSAEPLFSDWLVTFKAHALKNNISEETYNKTISNIIFLPKVIQYDLFQPEFYEDTYTYILKRTSKKKVNKGIVLYKKNKKFINSIEEKYLIEKELLLALMGIETNFGTYVGKMDILSSLATLSFNKRRSAFFTNELITILQLVENDVIDYKTLYGSWAGAFGYFQFMPTTIEKYAIDYDDDNIINLKSINDSFASAANYINKIGWKKNQPCFYKIKLLDTIPQKFLNTSAKKIHNKKKFKFFKQYIENANTYNVDDNLIAAIITPDKDIIPGSNNLKPAYIIFNNYELVLNWNRSLRFALAVCTLKDKFKNEL